MNPIADDIYISRANAAEKIQPRHDPVVYVAKNAPSQRDQERVQKYEESGYLVLDDVFTEQEVTYFQREAERLRLDQTLVSRSEAIAEPGTQVLRSLFDVQQFSAIFDKLLHDARLVGWARHLLNDDVYLHQSRLNYKPGFQGKEFYWHSDFETWHVEDGMPRMRALSMSIALSDNHACNGPVMIIPGSHQHFISCAGLTPEQNYQQSLRRQEYGVPSESALRQLTEGNDIAVVTGRAGSVLIFDSNTMHGSCSNITPYARNNLFFVYNAIANRLQTPFRDSRRDRSSSPIAIKSKC